MLDPLMRPVKDALLTPIARGMSGVPPNALTAAGLVLGLGAAAAGWAGAFGLGFGLWVANRVLDGLDGLVARTHDRVTDLGGYLDLVADFTVYAAIPLALALRPGVPGDVVRAAAILLAVFYVNAAAWMVLASVLEKRGQGAIAGGESTSITMPEGLVAGTESAIFYGLFFLLPGHLGTLFLVMAGMTTVGVFQRVGWAWRELP